MRFVGIVAEYNPFHSGHAAQLAMLRARGAKAIAVCLSAGAVQRGAFPHWPDMVRAKAALLAGADLVVALPAPYALKSAEGFADAGVSLLSALGCDTLAFGAETPNIALMLRTADTLLSSAFRTALRAKLDAGLPFAAARAAAAETLQPGAQALLRQPNNILGVEYAKAILRRGGALQALALPRLGAAGVGAAASPPGGGRDQNPAYASAATLRELADRKGCTAMAAFVPPAILALYQDSDLPDPIRVSTAILARLRGRTAGELAAVYGVSEGLENRLWRALHTAATLEQLYKTLSTKRYPNARLRRLVLSAALGIPKNLPSTPPYIHVLGAQKKALPLLADASLPVSTSLAKLKKISPETRLVATLYAQAVDLGALCCREPRRAGLAFQNSPVLL